MDKSTKYREVVRSIIHRFNTKSEIPEGYEELETQAIIDDANGHYFLMDVGWHKMERIHGCVMHIDIKKDKIWIQQDWTDTGVADLLLEAGIPKEDIVLAFHAPYKRPYTGFAVV